MNNPRHPNPEINEPVTPEYAETLEQQQKFRNAINNWSAFMDENPDFLEKLQKEDGRHGETWFFKPITLDVLTLEPSKDVKGKSKPRFWLIRGPEKSTSPIVTLEIPANIPNTAMQVSEQKIRPGVYEYKCGEEYIFKRWLSDPTANGVAPMAVTENIPTVSELDGLTMMLETAIPARIEREISQT